MIRKLGKHSTFNFINTLETHDCLPRTSQKELEKEKKKRNNNECQSYCDDKFVIIYLIPTLVLDIPGAKYMSQLQIISGTKSKI